MDKELNYQDLLNKNTIQSIKAWKYKGKDDSILYNLFLSPLAQYIVENHTPETIA